MAADAAVVVAMSRPTWDDPDADPARDVQEWLDVTSEVRLRTMVVNPRVTASLTAKQREEVERTAEARGLRVVWDYGSP